MVPPCRYPLTFRALLQRRGLSTSCSRLNDLQNTQAAFKGASALSNSSTSEPLPIKQAPHELDLRSALEEGKEKLLRRGYDATSFWEQPVVWGELDSFQHVNNVHYVRYLESGRFKWIMSVADELGGTARVQEIMKGQGVSFILKSISVQYKRPVTFPDTLLVAHKVHLPEASLDRNEWPKSHFHLAGTIWSCAQRAIVTESDSVVVWYDYDKLRKCDPGAESREAVWRRIKPT